MADIPATAEEQAAMRDIYPHGLPANSLNALLAHLSMDADGALRCNGCGLVVRVDDVATHVRECQEVGRG